MKLTTLKGSYLIVPVIMILIALLNYFDTPDPEDKKYVKKSVIVGSIVALVIFLNNIPIDVEDMITGPATF